MGTSFADCVPVKKLNSHEYGLTLEKQWCIGIVPNGGYITSALLIVAREHMSSTHAKRSQPNPINVHFEFMRKSDAGPAKVVVKDLKMGSRVSNLHISLLQQEPDSSWRITVEGYVMMSNIAAEEGVSLDTSYASHPRPLVVDLEKLGAEGVDMNWMLRRDPLASFRAVSHNIQIHLVRPGKRTGDMPKSVIDQWVRFTPEKKVGGRWTNDALGFLVDMFPQIIERNLNPGLEKFEFIQDDMSDAELWELARKENPNATYWYPTLALNLEVKAVLPHEGVEWLFVRVRTKAVKNGRYDLDIEVWDTNEQLIATSSHATLIVDAARNVAKRGQQKNANQWKL